MGCSTFGVLTEAEVEALAKASTAIVEDTYNLAGGGLAEPITIQALIDAVVTNLFEFAEASGSTTLGSDIVTVALSSQQVDDGFTTDHIVGYLWEIDGSNSELGVTHVSTKTASSITYKLSGDETIDSGHRLTIHLAKPKI